jgi:Mrp family chromosome partitioning ATPase
MIRALLYGLAAGVAAGSALLGVAAPADATELICLNHRGQFVVCPTGTVPVSPYRYPPKSTPPATAFTSPSRATVPAKPPHTTPAPAKQPLLTTPGTGTVTRRSAPAVRARQPLLLGIDILVLTAASVGLGLQLKNRRRYSRAGTRSKEHDTLSLVTVGLVVAGLALLVVGMGSDSLPQVYGSIGCAALVVVMLGLYRAAAPAVLARPGPTPRPGVAGSPGLSSLPMSSPRLGLLLAPEGFPATPAPDSGTRTPPEAGPAPATEPVPATEPPTRTPPASRTRTPPELRPAPATEPPTQTTPAPPPKPTTEPPTQTIPAPPPKPPTELPTRKPAKPRPKPPTEPRAPTPADSRSESPVEPRTSAARETRRDPRPLALRKEVPRGAGSKAVMSPLEPTPEPDVYPSLTPIRPRPPGSRARGRAASASPEEESASPEDLSEDTAGGPVVANRAEVDPERSPGEPGRSPGEPGRSSREPDRSGGQPGRPSREPDRSSREPERSRGEPIRWASIRPEVLESCLVALRRMGDANIGSMAVTSTSRGEGRTTVAIGLAATSSMELRRKTILLDLDLERGTVEKLTSVGPGPGVVEFLYDDAPLEDCLQAVDTEVGIVRAGRLGDRAGVSPRIERLAELLYHLSDRCDVLIADLPPLSSGLAAARMADLFESAILVVRAGGVAVPIIEQAATVLSQRPFVIFNAAAAPRSSRIRRVVGIPGRRS